MPAMTVMKGRGTGALSSTSDEPTTIADTTIPIRTLSPTWSSIVSIRRKSSLIRSISTGPWLNRRAASLIAPGQGDRIHRRVAKPPDCIDRLVDREQLAPNRIAQVRLNPLGEPEAGVEGAPEIDLHHQDHDHAHQGRRKPYPVLREQVGAISEQAPGVELAKREVSVLRHEQVEFVLEAIGLFRRDGDADGVQAVHDRVHVPIDGTRQEPDERPPLLGPEHTHDPEVEEDEIALRGDQQVARLRVGVKEPVLEDLAYVGGQSVLGHLSPGDAEPAERLPVIGTDSVDSSPSPGCEGPRGASRLSGRGRPRCCACSRGDGQRSGRHRRSRVRA